MSLGSSSTADWPIVIEDLTVRYGRVTALDHVSLRVARGTVYALLGRNGAGKSSLIRCLLGQQKPAGGRVRLHGLDPWTQRPRAMEHTGIVPEDPDAPPGMTVKRIAAFCAHVYPNWNVAAVDERLRRYEIPPALPFGRLSKGQKGLVGLALALGHSPGVLVLDDPTLGLDVAARRALFEEVVGDLADRGTTVLLTTHDLTGIEGIADRVGILKEGRLIVDEAMETLKERHAATSPALEEIFLALTAASGGGGAQ
jgi:ABC-2 type transport system ATP-binding protein